MKLQAILNTQCKHKLREVIHFDNKPKGEVEFNLCAQKYERKYLQCEHCGHWFSFHELDLTDLYKEDYVTSTYGGVEGMKRRFHKIMSLKEEQSDNFNRVERVNNFFSITKGREFKGKLLDIGCGLGVFPYAMQVRGWDVSGLEQDDRTLSYLKEEVGIEKIMKDISEVKKNEFDLISLNKVLEHVVDPIKLLTDVAKLIKDAGIVYIEVPDTENASTFGNPKTREEFFIEHHHGFTLASLSQAIDISGLRIQSARRILEPSGKYTIYCFATLSKSFYRKLI